jgi:GNAT superfamily N-acetyltransferase
MTEIRIVNTELRYCRALEELQRACFPTLSEDELLTEPMFRKHCELFPEGEFVALAGERVVGLGTGFFTDFDFDKPHHSFMEIIAGGYYTNHDPNGAWYYGADISVHPDYRGLGIGRMLYEARKDLVQRYNRRGIVAGGLIPGYAQYKLALSAKEYVDKVIAGEIWDSTLSFQLKNGFVVRGLLENYIADSAADNWATLIVWENPHYT